MRLLDYMHGHYVYGRRVRVLAGHLRRMLAGVPRPADGTALRVLDVGCGDGAVARATVAGATGIMIEGIDVAARPATHIPVRTFDGQRIPWPDDSFDVVMVIDVLHHAREPVRLLRDAARVARRAVLLKDHTREGWLAESTLRFMDRVGNARFDVPLREGFWPERRWREVFAELDLAVDVWEDRLSIYPPPLSWLFDRRLHFLARLADGGCEG